MDLIKDLRAQRKEISKEISSRAQLRKRTNLFSKDKSMQGI